jgi:hypothetical protein
VVEDKHTAAFTNIDQQLLTTAFAAVALTPNNQYENWYAKFLSAAALLVGDETVNYGKGTSKEDSDTVHIVMFTASAVLIADIDRTAESAPAISAISRRSIESMGLSASTRSDIKRDRPYDWPGLLQLTLVYTGLATPIEIVEQGLNPISFREPSAIVRLIDSLKLDLTLRDTTD